jgi:hypothetical protein
MPTRVLVLVALVLLAPASSAASRQGAGLDLFVIERNKNHNLVQYELRVDAACQPAGDEPVGSFWRMLELGPGVTEEVGLLEQRAYGIESQERGQGGLVVKLRALPTRAITVRAERREGGCSAQATAIIAGHPARLRKVYVFVDEGALIPSVQHIDLSGVAPDGSEVTERITRD